MGLLSGSIALRRYRVLARPPADFRELYEKAVRAHALVPLDPESGQNEQKSVGWCSVFDEHDLDLSFSKFYHDGRIMLSLRIDTLKPPTDEVRRLLKQRQREIEASRKEPMSASALRELKDMIVIDLRRRTPPKVKAVDVLWHLDEQRLYFLSHSKAMNEAFLRLFAETFNLGLDIEGPGFWASQMAAADDMEKALKKTRPTIELLGGFVGLRPCPRAHDVEDVFKRAAPAQEEPEDAERAAIAADLEDRRFLAREFLTWLIYRSDPEHGDGCFAESPLTDAFRVSVADRVLLKALGEGVGEITARGVAPAATPDVRYAIAGGLTVREVDLIFEQGGRGERLWQAAVNAEGFDLRRAKLPALLSEDDDTRLSERIELIDQVDVMLQAAFQGFLRRRLAPTWQTDELPKIRAWLKESIAVEAEPGPEPAAAQSTKGSPAPKTATTKPTHVKGTKLYWHGHGRDWSGAATGKARGDYTEVRLDPDSQAWGLDREDRSIGWVLSSHLRTEPPK